MNERVALLPAGTTLGSEYQLAQGGELAPEVADFQVAITETGKPRVLTPLMESTIPFPFRRDLTYDQRNHIKTQLADKPNGRLYVNSPEDANLVQGLTQQSRLSRTSIGETSAHQVFFTTLLGNQGAMRTAVKPFRSGGDGLIDEWVNTHLARERGFGAFEPVGFLTTTEGGYIITERRDDVEPMDNTNWEGILLEPHLHEAALGDIQQVGPLLARLHHAGGFHGDPQLKNIMLTEDGNLDFIDWEAARFMEIPAGQEDVALSLANRDFRVLFGSLARSVADKGVGFLANLTPTAQWSLFKEYIFTPYMNERLELVSAEAEQNDATLLHLAEVEDTIMRYVLEGKLYESLARARQRM